jgi:hypothetical protein
LLSAADARQEPLDEELDEVALPALPAPRTHILFGGTKVRFVAGLNLFAGDEPG